MLLQQISLRSGKVTICSWTLPGRGYLRFQDAPDTTERVNILHENFDKDWEPALSKWPSEVPLARFPDPETYNEQRGDLSPSITLASR